MKRLGTQFRLIALIAVFALVAAACGGDDSDTVEPTPSTVSQVSGDTLMSPNVGPACTAVPADGEGSFSGMADDPAATAASNNPVLSTLVGAVSQAGLVDTLNSEGPFTIFAPTNAAFAAIPQADLNTILGNNELLTSVLTYHVVAGESLDLAGLAKAGSVTTVNGQTLSFAPAGDLLTVNGSSMVACGNVSTANATVHIIDSVLVPTLDVDASGDDMLMTTNVGPACTAVPSDGEGSFAGMADDPAGTAASNNPVLTTLVAAVSEAGLVDTLNSEGPFTIFAPTNDAFGAIPAEDLNAILADGDLLTSILTYHVVVGDSLDLADLVKAESVTTVNGETLTFAPEGDLVSVNGSSMVVCGNVQTANATVHIIDTVLVPGA